MVEIAFFGVGTMGLPIVGNLLKAGHTVHICVHQSKEGPLEAEKLGAVLNSSPEQAVAKAEFVFCMVSDDTSVYDLMLKDSLRNAMRPGTIIIEMTTCSPGCVVSLQEFYKEHGVHVIDAPVTGGLIGAINGELIIIGAGKPEDFAKANAVFKPIAKKVFNFGATGKGKLVKAMTNLLGATTLAAATEFFRCAHKKDLDLEQLEQLMPFCAGGSVQIQKNFGKLVKDEFLPASFKLKLMRKDMGIALDELEGEFMPLADLAYRLYHNATPYDEEDCAAIVKVTKL